MNGFEPIDVEPIVYAKVATALRAAFKEIYVTGKYTPIPAEFPAVMFYQQSNPVYEPSSDLSNIENAVYPIFFASMFSNNQSTGKTECKKMGAVIATVMNKLGFTRYFDEFIPNGSDPSIERREQRYRRIVGGGDNI